MSEKLHYGVLFLQDTFWWCFLNRFQSDKDSQCRLFKRVALNYVKLVLSCDDLNVREAFLRVSFFRECISVGMNPVFFPN